MIRSQVVLLIILINSFSYGQSLINENFESWIDNTAFIDPEGWVTLNDLNPEYGLPVTVFKSTDAFAGQYAALLKTSTYVDFENKKDTMASLMVYGTNVNTGITYPWAKRLKTISFSYKYKPNGIDTGVMYLSVGYRDKKTSKVVNQGGAYYIFGKKEVNYTKVTLPLYYSSNNKCDTLVLAFINSLEKLNGNRNKPGTELYIDDIKTIWEDFPPVAIINEPEMQLGVYPNPASDVIHIIGLSSNDNTIKIIDVTGQIVLSENVMDESINIEKLKPGLYHLYLQSADGNYSGSTYLIKK